MTTSNTFLTAVFLRVVLPLVLTASIVFRPCGLSFLYLLLTLYLPLVPVPTFQTFKGGHAGRYLKAALFVSFLTVTAQFIFQVVLLLLPPYGDFLTDCQTTEKVLRHLGLVKLNSLHWTEVIRWLGPDAAALIVTIVTYVSISNFVSEPPPINLLSTDTSSTGPNSWNRILHSIGAYVSLGFLCLTSSLQPSIPSGVYYLVFIGGATWWALSRNIINKAFARIFSVLAIFVAIHIIALFLYQLQWAQELIDPQSLAARLVGLVKLVGTDCSNDPRNAIFNTELNWVSYVQPFALLFLCHLLVYEAKILWSPEVWNRLSSIRRTKRNYSTGRRNSINNETTPLMTFAPPRSRYNSTGRSFSGDGPSTGAQISSSLDNNIIPSRGQSITSRESCGISPSTQVSPEEIHELYEYDGYNLLLAGLSSVFALFAKSSYIATNIIMMAWSITYHSWLTFVLLLWACVLWMFPNQRKAMLVSSPGLVIYAELLLLAQYVYSLNLTDDELPSSAAGVNLAEIGLVKSPQTACLTILVKSLYTMMFWITLRQFVMERKDRETVEDAVQESFRITVSTTTTGAAVSELRQSKDESTPRPGLMMKFGSFIKEILTKFWIWVVAIMLFVIGLGGDKVVLYRIVYMALFLVFVLTFQLSYAAWRKMMYGFWLTVIIYSMLILVLIYTYQFENIPGYLTNYTGIPEQLQKDIGLESYDTGSLFVRLLTPTFFVVITVVQLHYFHKDFLKLSEMSSRNDRRRQISPAVSTDEEPLDLVDNFTLKNLIRNITFYGTQLISKVSTIYLIASEIGWRFLEIHIMKIVLFSAVMLTVNDTCALHFVLFLGIISSIGLSSTAQRLVVHLCSIFISSLLLAKMIYQIDYIRHDYWVTNCTIGGKNVTGNDAEWLGLRKIDPNADGRRSLPDLLKGYIGMILVLTIQAVVQIRQKYQRYMARSNEPIVGILFPEIQRSDADKGLLECFKFLLNYGFYKFGVELTLITMVAVIGTRLDLFSVLYSFWLIPMFFFKRQRLSKIWVPFILFMAILLPVQYLSCVGLPPFLCWEYPWINLDGELKIWLFLPDLDEPPMASRLIPDFFLLLFACHQQLVFRVEKNFREDGEFSGGSNRELTEINVPPFLNPTPDFLTYRKSWLDLIKRCVLLSFFWVTLAIIFLTGTNRVNLFALGYLVGSFTFLWEGNEFYLRSRKSIIKRWNYLVAYNVGVIFCKSLLQLVGCVFLSSLQYKFCWFVQLFGIACLNKFGPQSSAEHNKGISPDCSVPTDEAGLMWDGITFAFLLFQRRIFNSYYFFHIRAETEAQAKLASRGAELIEELMQKQIKQQEEQEKDVLEKIKMKMDRIKATHQGRPREHQDHFDGSRIDPASSLVSSPISMDETPVIEPDPKASPLAPLAVAISTAITSGSGPTPTPSSAAMTISVDGFFDPPYVRHPCDSLHPPHLPLSPSDDSFPVFSPPPYDHDPRMMMMGMGGRHTAGVGVQTSPPQRSFYPSLHSPALSHHTSIRSGDYYMFDENEDDDLAMIDSITEEEDEEDDEHVRPAGVTLSELMSSALKTDVESATEMARLARRLSDARDRDVGSLTDSTTGAYSTAATRRRSRKRPSKRSALSFRSDRGGRPSRGRDQYDPAPLAVSDGEGGSSAADHPGGGGDGEQPSTSSQAAAQAAAEPEQIPPQPRSTFMRRLLNYIRFTWAFLESVMVSATNYLNKFSRDYRHVSKCLAEEKLRLKEQELNQAGSTIIRGAASVDPLDFPTPRALKPLSPVWDQREEEETGIPASGDHIEVDLTKQLSTEESDVGGSGSKDDLQTVVEKPSPQKEKESDFDSMDKVSMSEVDEERDKRYPIVLLVTALWYVVISHSDVVCYFVVFLNQIKSASVLSLPLPLMVLFWGSLSVPRPTKTFWVTIIAYTEALVVIKYLFQFNFFPWNENKENQFKGSPFWPPRIMGVEQQEKYAVYDVTLLMVVFFHRFMLKSLGLWKNKSASEVYYSEEHPLEKDEEKRVSLVEAGSGDHQPEGSDITVTGDGDGGGCARAWEQWELQDLGLAYGPQVLKLCVKKYLSSIKLFFNQILNLEYKVKVDVYSYMFMCDFFNFLVVIFGFASFGSQSGDVSSYLEENKVPVPFLVMVILQFALIVIDRALYLRKYIVGKFFFQMILVTLVHVAMFFVLPGVTERPFNAALPPQMWYMVKCIYLLFSAYQIRSGYPTRILGNFLCKKYNYVNMFLFKGMVATMTLFCIRFMAVPFLFELRALMDWIWTDTSMTLSDWLKLEDIFAHVFQLKCQRRVEKEYPQGRGMPKARWTKYAIGGSSLFIIIAIIWFPLVLFALGNTVGVSNRPRDVSIQLTIGSYQPIFTMSAQNLSLQEFKEHDWAKMTNIFKDKGGLNFLNNYEPEDVWMAQLSGNSTSVWGISPPAKQKLIEELQSPAPVTVVMSWSVSRETNNNPTVQPTAKGKHEIQLMSNDSNRRYLVDMINGTAINESVTPAKIVGIFPKFIRVSNNGNTRVVKELDKGLHDVVKWDYNNISNAKVYYLRNLTLTLQRSSETSGNSLEWWELQEDCHFSNNAQVDLPLGDKCAHLNFYTFNEKAFPPTLSWVSGGGIIGLYTTLVLVASKFVRSFFAGISFLIMFDDMPNVDRIFQLCLDIYLVRESGELALEEDLFAKLIFLYRSPETLIKWTRLKRVREPPPNGDENAQGTPNRAIQQ